MPPEFHRYMIQAQDSRLLGDYDALSPRSEKEALKHIGRAREFVALTEKLLGEEEPPVVRDRPAQQQAGRPAARPVRRRKRTT